MQTSSSHLSTLQSHAESLDWLFAAAAAAAFILPPWPVEMKHMLTTLAVSLDALLGCAINVSRKTPNASDNTPVHQVVRQESSRSRSLKELYLWVHCSWKPKGRWGQTPEFRVGPAFQWPLLNCNLRKTFKFCSRVLKSANNVPILWTGLRRFALQSQNLNEQFLWHLCFVPP